MYTQVFFLSLILQSSVGFIEIILALEGTKCHFAKAQNSRGPFKLVATHQCGVWPSGPGWLWVAADLGGPLCHHPPVNQPALRPHPTLSQCHVAGLLLQVIYPSNIWTEMLSFFFIMGRQAVL